MFVSGRNRKFLLHTSIQNLTSLPTNGMPSFPYLMSQKRKQIQLFFLPSLLINWKNTYFESNMLYSFPLWFFQSVILIFLKIKKLKHSLKVLIKDQNAYKQFLKRFRLVLLCYTEWIKTYIVFVISFWRFSQLLFIGMF